MDQDSFPTSYEELGVALQKLRGKGRSLRDISLKTHLSKSTLHRYESGLTPIPVENAVLLDKAYDSGGWIEAAINVLGRGMWKPWRKESPKRVHAHRWPAKCQGLVWVVVKPAANRVGEQHELVLRWGPWRSVVTTVLPEEGVALTTGKDVDADGVAVTLNLDCDPPAYALFGIGEDLDGVRILDIRQQWDRQ